MSQTTSRPPFAVGRMPFRRNRYSFECPSGSAPSNSPSPNASVVNFRRQPRIFASLCQLFQLSLFFALSLLFVPPVALGPVPTFCHPACHRLIVCFEPQTGEWEVKHMLQLIKVPPLPIPAPGKREMTFRIPLSPSSRSVAVSRLSLFVAMGMKP